MTSLQKIKALLPRIYPAIAAVALLGAAGSRLARYASDCCYPGAPCCHPGAPCCAGHGGQAGQGK